MVASCAVIVTMTAAPVMAQDAQLRRMPALCANADGKPRPIYMCASKGPADKSTMAEAEKLIIDRQSFNMCHAKAQGPGFNPSVGWGTYVDTPAELNAGKCPKPDAMQEWFKRDLASSYSRGQAQARALRMDNACMVRTLTAINHQVGDLQRKYPNVWKKMVGGKLCEVAVNMLEWSWYQQSCDRTLDTALAFDNMAQCKVSLAR